jgi:hypothetical protein
LSHPSSLLFPPLPLISIPHHSLDRSDRTSSLPYLVRKASQQSQEKSSLTRS